VAILCPPHRVERPPWVARALCVGLSAFSRSPAKAIYSKRSGLGDEARRCLPQLHGDVTIINGADTYWFADEFADSAARRVLVCHNIESVFYRALVQSRGALERFVVERLLGDVEKFERLEFRAFRESDLILCISGDDAAFIRARFEGTPVHHVPPVFGYPSFAVSWAPPAQAGPLRLGFLAKYSWWPNVEAVRWFADVILPHLPDDRELHLFGCGSERYHAPDRRVFAHGYVTDLTDIWRASDIMLCPMRKGGGVNIKFAEALYNGQPVCATPMAARGLGIEPRDVAGLRFLGESAEWIRFLSSEQARSFAAARPGPELGAKFALSTQVEPLRAAFERAVFR
jgi:hypothetical protein